jgi:hypothetical protein
MHRVMRMLSASALLFGLALYCRAADDETGPIIDKAIKAHGFKDKGP